MYEGHRALVQLVIEVDRRTFLLEMLLCVQCGILLEHILVWVHMRVHMCVLTCLCTRRPGINIEYLP